ncbi:MAG: Protein of unknown function UPF0150, partial [uncultured Sphingomonadaceae bacterium]
ERQDPGARGGRRRLLGGSPGASRLRFARRNDGRAHRQHPRSDRGLARRRSADAGRTGARARPSAL